MEYKYLVSLFITALILGLSLLRKYIKKRRLVKSEINEIIENTLNSYKGRMMKPLENQHNLFRAMFGDKAFLKMLRSLELEVGGFKRGNFDEYVKSQQSKK